MVGHTPSYTEYIAIRYFVSKNQSKVTCKISLHVLGLCVFLSQHNYYTTILVLCIIIHLQGQTDPYRESYMFDLIVQKRV